MVGTYNIIIGPYSVLFIWPSVCVGCGARCGGIWKLGLSSGMIHPGKHNIGYANTKTPKNELRKTAAFLETWKNARSALLFGKRKNVRTQNTQQ
jgi:hypothetical protein